MFTGIVEKVGTIVRSPEGTPDQQGVSFSVSTGFADLALGESVAVNGVCLTVTSCDSTGQAAFDVSPETLEKTNLGSLSAHARVNLERALLPTTRLSGHWVQGHVDACGRWVHAEKQGEYWKVEIEIPRSLARYCVPKGSITIDGTSLTINRIQDRANAPSSIEIMLIPHTWEHTRLSDLRPGDSVNLEMDILAKMTERLLQCRNF